MTKRATPDNDRNDRLVKNQVIMYEDWNERDGEIYYRWRFRGEKEWHERLSPYKDKPFIQYRYVTQQELKRIAKECDQQD